MLRQSNLTFLPRNQVAQQKHATLAGITLDAVKHLNKFDLKQLAYILKQLKWTDVKQKKPPECLISIDTPICNDSRRCMVPAHDIRSAGVATLDDLLGH